MNDIHVSVLARRKALRHVSAPAAFGLLLIVFGCAAPGSSASVAPPDSANNSIPASATIVPAPGGPIVDETHGLALTLPEGWVGIHVDDATDEAKMAALKAGSAERAKHVDDLLAAMAKHPEYWLAAMRESDQSVLTAQIREFPEFEAWKAEQLTALQGAYGEIETIDLTTPGEGVSYSWTANGFDQRLDGFRRPGGATLFTFAGKTGLARPQDWDAAIATFTDAGT